MPSDEFYDDLSRWIDGELPPKRHAQVTAHLKSCTTCRETLREFTQLSAVLRGMAASDAPANVTDSAMRLVRAQARAEGKSRWPHIFPALFDLRLLKVGMCVTAGTGRRRTRYRGQPSVPNFVLSAGRECGACCSHDFATQV